MRELKLLLFSYLFFFATFSKAQDFDWPIGCWNCRSWGAMRLLEDGYCIDTDPEGLLNDWGVWQHFCGPDAVIVMWMESSRVEIIENNNGKYYHQTSYSFGIGSAVEEIQKIGK